MRGKRYPQSLIGALSLVLVVAACGDTARSVTANAGSDFDVTIGASPTFDGCASSGDVINYQWTIVEAPEKMALDVGKVIRNVESSCSFTLEAAMLAGEVGEWVIELTVSDDAGDTDTDKVTVRIVE